MKKRKAVAPPVAAPEAAPLLEQMAAYKAAHEAKRQDDFPTWKAAVEAADGNLSRLGEAMFPERETKSAANAARNQARRLGLLAYAAELRVKATGNAGAGRPKARK